MAFASESYEMKNRSQQNGTSDAMTGFTTEPWSTIAGLPGGAGGGGWGTGQEDILTDAQRQQADEILLILRYVAIFLAVPLTLCNVVVFLRKEMRSAAAVYVISISASQLVLVTVSTVYIIAQRTIPDPVSSFGYLFVAKYVYVFCGIVARRGSYLVLTLVSVERLYAILRPLHVRTFFLSRRPFLAVTSAYAISITLHVYLLAKSEIVAAGEDPNGTGSTVYRLVPTSLYLEHPDVSDFFGVAAKVVLTYVALTVQVVLAALTIFFLRRHNQQSKGMQSASTSTTTAKTTKEESKRRQERVMTVTILAATIGYVLLSLPAAIHNLVQNIIPQYYDTRGRYSNLYRVLHHLVEDLTIFSCGVDFVFLVTLSSNYRRQLMQICGCHDRHRGNIGSSAASTLTEPVTAVSVTD